MTTDTDTATPMMTDFMFQHPVRMTAERTDRNPNMADASAMDHWRVTLWYQKRRMTLVFSQGYGHKGKPPEVESVLDCLASDASSYDSTSGFPEWARDYGYNADSMTAHRTFRAIAKQTERLRHLLGDEAFNALVYHTERM